MRTVYETTVNITNIEHGTAAIAQVVAFYPSDKLVVSHSGVDITMNYDSRSDKYIGNAAGLEFIADAPAVLATYREATR